MDDEDTAFIRKVKDEDMPHYYEIAQTDPDDMSDTYFRETLQEAYYTIWSLVDIIDKITTKKEGTG